MPRMNATSEFTLRDLTKALIVDGYASQNDAKIIERIVEQGSAPRVEIDHVIDMIENSGLADHAKRSALRELAMYTSETAKGLEKELYGVELGLAARLADRGIGDTEALLAKASTPAQRMHLADEVGYSEEKILRAAVQSDLQRVSGIGPKMADALAENGIQSMADLAAADPGDLRAALKEFAGSMEGWVTKFRAPSESRLEGFIEQAKTLPAALHFGANTQGLDQLSKEERANMMTDESLPADLNYLSISVKDFLQKHSISNKMPDFEKLAEDPRYEMLERANDWDYNGGFTMDDLLAGDIEIVDDNGDPQDVSIASEPEIMEYLDENGDLVGAIFTWEAYDGIEGERFHLLYDNIAGEFTATAYDESANGDNWLTML